MDASVWCIVLCCIASLVTGQNRFIQNGRQNGRRSHNQMFTNRQQHTPQMSWHPHNLRVIPVDSGYLISKPRSSRSNYAQLVLTRNSNISSPRERTRAFVLYPINDVSSNRVSLHDILTGSSSRLSPSSSTVILDEYQRTGRSRVRPGQVVFVVPRKVRRRLRPSSTAVAGDPVRRSPRFGLRPRLKVIYLGDNIAKTRRITDRYSSIRDLYVREKQHNDIFAKQTPRRFDPYFIKHSKRGRKFRIVRLDKGVVRTRQNERTLQKTATNRDANLGRSMREQLREKTRLQFPYPQNIPLGRFRSSVHQIPAKNKLTNSLRHIARLSGRSSHQMSMYPSHHNSYTAEQIQQAQADLGSRVVDNSLMHARTMNPTTTQPEPNPTSGNVQPTPDTAVHPNSISSNTVGNSVPPTTFVQLSSNQAQSNLNTGTVQPAANNIMHHPGLSSNPELLARFDHTNTNQAESKINSGAVQPTTDTVMRPQSAGNMGAFNNNELTSQRGQAVLEMRYDSNIAIRGQTGNSGSQPEVPTNSKMSHFHTPSPEQRGVVLKHMSPSPTPSSGIPGVLAKSGDSQLLRHVQQNPDINVKATIKRQHSSLKTRPLGVVQTPGQLMHNHPTNDAKLPNSGVNLVNREMNIVNPSANMISSHVNILNTGVQSPSGQNIYPGIVQQPKQSVANIYSGIQQDPKQSVSNHYPSVQGQSEQSAANFYPGVQTQVKQSGYNALSGTQRQFEQSVSSLYPRGQVQSVPSPTGIYSGVQTQSGQSATGVNPGVQRQSGQTSFGLYRNAQRQLGKGTTNRYPRVQLGHSATGLHSRVQEQMVRSGISLYPNIQEQLTQGATSFYPGGNSIAGGINLVNPAILGQLRPRATSLSGLVSQHQLSNTLFKGNPLLAPQVGTVVKPSLLVPTGGVVSKVSGGETEVITADGRRIKLEGSKVNFE